MSKTSASKVAPRGAWQSAGSGPKGRSGRKKVVSRDAKAGRRRKTRGERLVARLRGEGEFKMSTDDILALMRGPPADEDTPPRK